MKTNTVCRVQEDTTYKMLRQQVAAAEDTNIGPTPTPPPIVITGADCPFAMEELYPSVEQPKFDCATQPVKKLSTQDYLIHQLSSLPLIGDFFAELEAKRLLSEYRKRNTLDTVKEMDRFVQSDIRRSLVNPAERNG